MKFRASNSKLDKLSNEVYSSSSKLNFPAFRMASTKKVGVPVSNQFYPHKHNHPCGLRGSPECQWGI